MRDDANMEEMSKVMESRSRGAGRFLHMVPVNEERERLGHNRRTLNIFLSCDRAFLKHYTYYVFMPYLLSLLLI